MGMNLYDIFVSWFGRGNSFERDMLTYAKTEYGEDWRFAYKHLKAHKGKGPKMGVYK